MSLTAFIPTPVKKFYRRFSEASISTNSAALAFHTLLSLIPVIGLVFLYLREIGVSKSWVSLTRNFLLSQINVNSSNALLTYFDKLTRPIEGNSLGWIGLIVLLYTAWMLLSEFGESLDQVLETSPNQHHIQKRGSLITGLRRWMAMFLLPIGISFSLAISQWIKQDSWLHYIIDIKTVGHFIALPIPWIVNILILFLVYYFVPKIRVSRQQAFKAAVIIGPIIECSKLLFAWGTQYSVIMHKIYGILVVIPLFMLWVQLLWVLICAYQPLP